MSSGGRQDNRRQTGRNGQRRGSSAGASRGKSGGRSGSSAGRYHSGSGSRKRTASKTASSAAAKRKRNARRKKHRILAGLILAAAAVIVIAGLAVHAFRDAFGPEDYDAPTAEFRKNGSIRVTSVETFSEDYYSSDELASTISGAVRDYNSANGDGSVKEESFSVENGNAKVVLIYRSAADYQSFNNTTLFRGTVQEAEDSGFDFESIMEAVSNEDSTKILTQATLDQLLANQTIILTEQVNVVLPRRWSILYATPNLGVTDFQHAAAIDTISDEKPAIIILK